MPNAFRKYSLPSTRDGVDNPVPTFPAYCSTVQETLPPSTYATDDKVIAVRTDFSIFLHIHDSVAAYFRFTDL